MIVPLSMLIYSNSRITDTKETLRAEIKAETEALRAEIKALEARIDRGFERLEQMLKIHELEHHK